MARTKTNCSRLLILVWVYIPLAAAVASAGVLAYIIVEQAGPPDVRLLLELAAGIAFLLGLTSWGSVVAGAKLLADETTVEPVKLREAGWLLGVPIGLLAGVVLILRTPPQLEATFLQAYAIPLAITVSLGSVLWAAMARVLARAAGLSFEDYACGLLLPRERYLALKDHKQAVREQARRKE